MGSTFWAVGSLVRLFALGFVVVWVWCSSPQVGH